MKKNKLFVHEMLAIMLVLCFSFASCDTDASNGGLTSETSKTMHYSKIELYGDTGEWGSEWDSWEWVKFSDIVPQGVAKPLTMYSITVEGNTDKVLSAFSLRLYAVEPWTVFKNWTEQKSVDGNFTYRTVFTTPGNTRVDDFNCRSYLALGNTGNPLVTIPDEIEATLTNITITVEEVSTVEGKSIKITGTTHTDTNGEAEVFILNEPVWGGDNFIARSVYHSGHIVNGELYVDLNGRDGYDASDDPWNGSGKYYILLMIADTNGFHDEGGTNHNYWWAKDGVIEKYDIKDVLTTLDFSHFKK
jgi:hypothetical protein